MNAHGLYPAEASNFCVFHLRIPSFRACTLCIRSTIECAQRKKHVCASMSTFATSGVNRYARGSGGQGPRQTRLGCRPFPRGLGGPGSKGVGGALALGSLAHGPDSMVHNLCSIVHGPWLVHRPWFFFEPQKHEFIVCCTLITNVEKCMKNRNSTRGGGLL